MVNAIAIVLLLIVGVGGMVLLMRHYHRQGDYAEPPGKVPEDYS